MGYRSPSRIGRRSRQPPALERWDLAAEPSPELSDLARWIARRVKALDLGSGRSVDALWLAEQGFATTAVQSSAERAGELRHAAERRGVTLRIEHREPSSYRIRGMYDMILAGEGIAELPRDAALDFLRTVQARTRRGGYNFIALHPIPGGTRPGDPGSQSRLVDGELFSLYEDWRVLLRQSYLGAPDEGVAAEWFTNRIIAQRP